MGYIKGTSTLIIILLSILIWGCTSPKKSDDVDTTKASPKIDEQSSIFFKDKIIGIWTGGESPNATFEINKDSIYYVDHFKSYKYTLKNDSIKIFYDDYDYSAKIYFLKDTLVMNSPEYDIAKFWKFND